MGAEWAREVLLEVGGGWDLRGSEPQFGAGKVVWVFGAASASWRLDNVGVDDWVVLGSRIFSSVLFFLNSQFFLQEG